MDEATPQPSAKYTDPGNKENRGGHKGGAGVNLRKSLAWDNAFFTDEGILNTTELSVLARSKPVSGTRSVLSGIQEEFLTPLASKNYGNNSSASHAVDDSSRSRSKYSLLSRGRERVASRLFPDVRPSIPEAPIKSLPNQNGCKSVLLSSVANSQKRLAHACPRNPLSKIPKLKGKLAPPEPPMSQVPTKMNSQDLRNSTSDHVILDDNRNDVIASKKNAINSTKPPVSHSGRNLVSHNGNTSYLLRQQSTHTDLHTKDSSVADSKLETFSLSVHRLGQNPSSGCSVRPSALRMPSPSLGFFMQGKSGPSQTITSPKITNMQSNTVESLKKTICRTIGAKESKPARHGMAIDNAPGINNGAEIPNSEDSKGTENLALHSHMDAYADKEHEDAGLTISDTCIETSCPVLSAESANHDPIRKNVSVTDVLSDGALFLSVGEKHIDDRLNLEAEDCLLSVEVQRSTFQNADQTSLPFIDNDGIPIHQLQHKKIKDVQYLMNNSDASLPMELPCCTTYSDSDDNCVNVQTEAGSIISAAEEDAININTHASNVLKQVDIKLKCQITAEPFSEEWVATVETFGEDILRMKTGAVQNSPTEKVLPEPSPWSPIKKNQDLGPYSCTKYTKETFPS